MKEANRLSQRHRNISANVEHVTRIKFAHNLWYAKLKRPLCNEAKDGDHSWFAVTTMISYYEALARCAENQTHSLVGFNVH